MDKIATNNFIVELRSDVKAAKSMVAGNLVRKINELKKALEKDDDSVKKEKSEKKVQDLLADIKLLKTIDPYLICKNAILKPDPKHWTNLIGDSKAPEETRLMARIISKGRIQKQVSKFRSDHKDCDEWLNEYFEFREKKRELTEIKVTKRKAKQAGTTRQSKVHRGSNSKSSEHGQSKKPKDGKIYNRRDRTSAIGRKQQTGGNVDASNGRVPTENNTNSKQESLHPSWASKRKEKDILKAALSGKVPVQSKRIILNSN